MYTNNPISFKRRRFQSLLKTDGDGDGEFVYGVVVFVVVVPFQDTG